MPVQFFGQFLIQKGLVTPVQLLHAVDYQATKNLKLGELAVVRGMLAEADATRINGLQQSKDLQFGAAAVELKLLTAAQVDELLLAQRNSHVYLGDALVQCGALSAAVVERELGAFKEDQRAYEAVGTAITAKGVPQVELHTLALDLTQKLLMRAWFQPSKVGTQAVRTGTLPLVDFTSEIAFSGGYAPRYILSIPEPIVKNAAKRILGDLRPDDETCADLTGEFANVVCGNVSALLAKKGINSSFGTPMRMHMELKLGRGKALETHFVTPDGDVTLFLVFA